MARGQDNSMTFRPFRESDIPEIQRIYAANGIKEGRTLAPLPDLKDQTRAFAFVLEDEAGRIKAAFIFRSVVEAISVAEDAKDLHFCLLQHEVLRQKFKASRIRQVVTWTKRRSVGRFLERMGWWKIPPDTEAYTLEVG